MKGDTHSERQAPALETLSPPPLSPTPLYALWPCAPWNENKIQKAG